MTQFGLGLAHLLHQAGETGGVGRILVGRQPLDPKTQYVFQAVSALEDQRLGWRHKVFDRLRIHCGAPAPGKSFAIGFNRHTVEFDGSHQGLHRQRQQAFLAGKAEHEQIGGHGVAAQCRGQTGGVHVFDLPPCRFVQQSLDIACGKLPIRLARELTGRLFMGVDHHPGAADAHFGQGVMRGRGQHVASQNQVGLARGNALRADRVRGSGNAHV